MTCLAWNTTPTLADLCRAIEQHTAPLYLIVCLPENHIPRSSREMPSVQQRQRFRKPIA